MNNRSFTLQGKSGLVVTKHGKESVILSKFADALDVHVGHLACDTDILGTFSGEIPRSTSALEAARTKCIWALDSGKVDFAIASEGSFGPHPILMSIPVHHELLLLKEAQYGLEWVEQTTSLETNYNQQIVHDSSDLLEFAQRIGFPEHGIILQISNQQSPVFKDARTEDQLLQQFEQLEVLKRVVLAQTDMRAHRNPTRMKIIEQLAEKLAKRMSTICPSCEGAGFGFYDIRTGAPCKLCRTPSTYPLQHIHHCVHCAHQEYIDLPEENRTIDPQYCQICNP